MRHLVLPIALLSVASVCAAHGEGQASDKIVVVTVMPGTAAEAAGVVAGDEILSLAGETIAKMNDLEKVLTSHQPGDAVPLVVGRAGEEVELRLVFGASPGGGVSVGLRLEIPEAADGGERTEGTINCLGWIEETYRVGALAEALGLDLSAGYDEILACVERDTQRMSSNNAIRYCDNVFKVHCSALDLLTEIGEARIEHCEAELGATLGLDLGEHGAWRACAESRIFDSYSMSGEASDCRTVLLEECGKSLDVAFESDQLSADQRRFTGCCSAESLASGAAADAAAACEMFEDTFSQGPCHQRPVCVNRQNGEWLSCSLLDQGSQ